QPRAAGAGGIRAGRAGLRTTPPAAVAWRGGAGPAIAPAGRAGAESLAASCVPASALAAGRAAETGAPPAMARRRQVYEGKAKILFEGPEPGTLVQYFKDDATAFNAQKKGTITGKGVLNNRISEHIFTLLGAIGVETHFVRRLNMREQLIRQVEIIPIEVVRSEEHTSELQSREN